MGYVKGDFWRVCDVCGFEYRASQTRKRWDNLIVCQADFEERHPQDFVRGRADRQTVPDPRPETVDIVIGPLTTSLLQAAVAGATSIYVASSVRFAASDRIGLPLDGGSEFQTTVQSVVDTTQISITDPLPISISAGGTVTNYSAISTPVL